MTVTFNSRWEEDSWAGVGVLVKGGCCSVVVKL